MLLQLSIESVGGPQQGFLNSATSQKLLTKVKLYLQCKLTVYVHGPKYINTYKRQTIEKGKVGWGFFELREYFFVYISLIS